MAGQFPHEITQRELRNNSDVIMRRRTFVPRQEVLAAFATAPILDSERFRNDIDAHCRSGPDWGQLVAYGLASGSSA